MRGREGRRRKMAGREGGKEVSVESTSATLISPLTIKLVLYYVVEYLQQVEDQVVVVGLRKQEPGC